MAGFALAAPASAEKQPHRMNGRRNSDAHAPVNARSKHQQTTINIWGYIPPNTKTPRQALQKSEQFWTSDVHQVAFGRAATGPAQPAAGARAERGRQPGLPHSEPAAAGVGALAAYSNSSSSSLRASTAAKTGAHSSSTASRSGEQAAVSRPFDVELFQLDTQLSESLPAGLHGVRLRSDQHCGLVPPRRSAAATCDFF